MRAERRTDPSSWREGDPGDGSFIPYSRLPEGFVERSGRRSRPVEPRPAATVVLYREVERAPPPGSLRRSSPERRSLPSAATAPESEVLLVRRSRSAGFVPGAYVFPGGRVDEADTARELSELADPCRMAELAGQLGLDPRPASGYLMAAVREAFEETGILLARSDGAPVPPGADSPRVGRLQQDLLNGHGTLADVFVALDARVDLEAVAYIAHWVTPLAEPRRYDTRFFAARVPDGSEALIDSREMTDALWLTPREALARHARGRLPMIFPTLRTLENLAGHRNVRKAVEAISSASVPRIMPELVMEKEGARFRYERR
ncbi:MAG: NUDIX hydrolase [Gemmatimonadetes bacterium]|nr:NUDIX hydrolase [Gemmatimonadota bacterium]